MKNKEKILERVRNILEKEPKLIEIEKAKQVVFVGDTHGDLEASQKVIRDYLKPGNKIVFLGDYVDRGPHSKENLDFLLEMKLKNPGQIYLLQGNHEGHRILEFSPADFWESLNEKEYKIYASIVEKFPLILIVKNIIALHGVLPNVATLNETDKIKLGNGHWLQICWGDFRDVPGKYLGLDPMTGRPLFGKNWFFEMMEKFKKDVLIRSHQPDAPQFMFEDKCLTIFTSSAYTRERLQPAHHPPTAIAAGPSIAILDLKKEIKTAKNLEIIRI